MQGFTRSQLVGAIVNDVQGSSPAAFETQLTAGSLAARTGTTLTAHVTPHTKAATYTDLIASTAQTAYGIWVLATDVVSSAADTGMLCDIAKGAAASEIDLITNIDLGEASFSATAAFGKIFYFPGLSIPSGTRISARVQATITLDTCALAIWLDNRMQWNIANSAWVTYGANTAASQGTSVPSAANTFGAWTAVGSVTSRAHKMFTVGLDSLGDTTLTASTVLIDIGWGPNAGSITNIATFYASKTAGESVSSCFPPVTAYNVAIGSQLWARIAGISTENRGVIIYGN
jgi:hypothetical protein